MRQKLQCAIPSSSLAYEIEFLATASQRSASLLSFLKPLASQFAIITDTVVAKLYGQPLLESLSAARLKACLFSFPSGEANKTRTTKESLEDQLFEKQMGRDTCIIALGGGVVTDLAGYIAATYCRGLPLIMVPTSLLAMVDACIGGKTGVNTPYGKNLVGCFYQPRKIFIDLSTLHSLPMKEIKNGMVEMIKHGLIADAEYFFRLETQSEKILSLESDALHEAIFGSCRIKNEIVQQDEKERGLRHLLNFGHTVGHAIEHISSYAVSHGEAVATGMLAEAHLSMSLGFLSEKAFARVKNILHLYRIPLTSFQGLSSSSLLQAMSRDKKCLEGNPRFVLLQEVGLPCSFESKYCTTVDEGVLKKSLDWICNDLRRH